MTKKRNPIISFLLSCIVEGLGQVYNTQVIKGVVYFFIPYAFLFIYSLTGLQYHFKGLITVFIMLLVYRLFVAVEAAITASRKGSVTLRKFNKTIIYIAIVIIAIIMSSAVEKRDLLGIQYSMLVGNSMEPNLQDRDRLIINQRVDTFKKGDIIIFEFKGKDFIQRIVGTAGDTIEITSEAVYINDKAIEEPYIEFPPGRGYQKTTIPEHHVFVLGDNRPISLDSRDLGPVHVDNIIGKAEFIIYSSNSSNVGKDLSVTFPSEIK